MIDVRVLNLVTNAESRFFMQQVQALERRGIESTTVAVPGTRDQTDDDSSPRSAVDYLRFYPQVLSSVRGHDIVHANYGLTAPAALAQPTRPVVVSLWGSDLMGRYGRLSRWCARLADAVIVMSEGMAALLGTECHVIPHGVDLDRFRPAPRGPACDRVGWRRDRTHVLFPYPATREVKNYPRAERVVEAARERVDDEIELHTLYGVPHERMPDYMNAADALLLTSRREGSPNSVKEALACNLPVVATDVGDVRERLDGVDLSFVCRTDDQLVDGLVEVCRSNGRSTGRQNARGVSLERMGERIESVYESVVETDADERPERAVIPR